MTTASRTDLELVSLEARRTELLAQKAKEDKARDAATPAVRELASALHGDLCQDDHPSLQCAWVLEGDDWSGPSHQRWLKMAAVGLAAQSRLGWAVTEPVAL